jgi:hypothetical protein
VELSDWLRLFVVVGLAYGAWTSWKRLPVPVRLNGRRYYPQPDGGFRTLWGRRVRDPALLAALKRAAPATPGAAP